MSYTYKKATVTEIVKVYRSIPEFSHFKSLADLKKRLIGKPHLILAAYHYGEVAGFKIGYGRGNKEFYSWLGAVNPKHRGKGVAHGLLSAQEKWAKSQGFHIISVTSRNRFPEMMSMLLQQNYRVVDFEQRTNIEDNKVHFSKPLV